jgi:Flp pilus assembly protein TadG
MRNANNSVGRSQAGQSIVETVLMMPVLLLFLLNAVNFGYFFFVATNLAAAPRNGAEYSIMGGATTAAIELPTTGPNSDQLSTSFLVNEDMRGALSSPGTNAAVQVCSPSAGALVGAGTTTARAPCVTYGTPPAGFSFPAVQVEPELNAGSSAPAFVLHQVDVVYKFIPLIPGTPFNILLLASPICSISGANVSCVFHRQSVMRGMN